MTSRWRTANVGPVGGDLSPKAFGLTPAYPENDTVRDDVIGDKSPPTLELL